MTERNYFWARKECTAVCCRCFYLKLHFKVASVEIIYDDNFLRTECGKIVSPELSIHFINPIHQIEGNYLFYNMK